MTIPSLPVRLNSCKCICTYVCYICEENDVTVACLLVLLVPSVEVATRSQLLLACKSLKVYLMKQMFLVAPVTAQDECCTYKLDSP